MNESVRIVLAEPVIHGVLKMSWDDGFEGIVDVRPFLAIGKAYAPLRDPKFFEAVKIADFGHAIEWTDASGKQIDFGADSLQKLSQRQAGLLLKAASAA